MMVIYVNELYSQQTDEFFPSPMTIFYAMQINNFSISYDIVVLGGIALTI